MYRQVIIMEYYDSALLTQAPVTEVHSPPPTPDKPPESRFWKLFRRQFWAALFLAVAVLTMQAWWPAGAETARKWLVCEEIGPVEAAAQAFVADVLDGEPLPDAAAAFCQTVLEDLYAPG